MVNPTDKSETRVSGFNSVTAGRNWNNFFRLKQILGGDAMEFINLFKLLTRTKCQITVKTEGGKMSTANDH